MKHTFLLLTVLLVAFIPASAKAQGCGLVMQPHYTAYHSATISGGSIHTMTSTQGYTVVGASAGCNVTGVTHQLNAHNTLSTAGGTHTSSGCVTCYLSSAEPADVVGVPGVVYYWNWTANLDCSRAGILWGPPGGSPSLPFVMATLSFNATTGTQPALDNGARDAYNSLLGTYSLGEFSNTNGCWQAYEFQGLLTPPSYTGNVTLRRAIISTKVWVNGVDQGVAPPPDDTSNLSYRDDNPQSANGGHTSVGIVYDLDAPSIHITDLTHTSIATLRVNFSEYATITLSDGYVMPISPNYNFYVREACKTTAAAPGYVHDHSVTGDNQVGNGATPLSNNLL